MKIGVVWRKNRNIELHEKYLGISLPDDSKEECLMHCKGIMEAGYDVEVIEWYINNPRNTIEKIYKIGCDLVFNASYEEICLLEAFGIPYSGSGIDLVSIDKAVRKMIVAHYGVPTPPFQIFSKNNEEDFRLSIPTPVIVKPVRGRSSCGITDESVVYDSKTAYAQALKLEKALGQKALIETFIKGREITVGILGNEHPEIIALLEIEYTDAVANTFENKKDKEIFHCPPCNIGKQQENDIVNAAIKAYKALGARDYARIDFIVADDGTPYFLELNTFPGLHMKSGNEKNLHSSYIGTMSNSLDWSYSEVYRRIIRLAMARLKIKER